VKKNYTPWFCKRIPLEIGSGKFWKWNKNIKDQANVRRAKGSGQPLALENVVQNILELLCETPESHMIQS